MSGTRIHLSPPDVGESEREALLRAFDSGWIAPAGPEIDAFETELAGYVGWPGVVVLSSGTAALHLALLALGVASGDDVLVSTSTFVASANAVRYLGARPCFVDSERDSWNMSPELLGAELVERARRGDLPAAVIVVDVYGQCADYDRIVPICAEYGVPIVEDAAEAMGSSHRGRPAGTLGSVGVFSFNGNKIITTSGGGALVCPSTAVAERVRHLASQARTGALYFEHDEVGFNYRLSNLLAALGRAQLGRLESMVRRRREIDQTYRAAFADNDAIEFMPLAEWGEWNGWLSCATLASSELRDALVDAMAADLIESRPLFNPMHLQPAFRDAPARIDGTSEWLFRRGVCLPTGSGLPDSDVRRVVDVMRTVLS